VLQFFLKLDQGFGALCAGLGLFQLSFELGDALVLGIYDDGFATAFPRGKRFELATRAGIFPIRQTR
jgi:hypothetical protein